MYEGSTIHALNYSRPACKKGKIFAHIRNAKLFAALLSNANFKLMRMPETLTECSH